MRLKLLLLLLVISGALYAQEPYRNLIFTEMRGDDTRFNYIEITNMGNKTVDLAEFEVGNYDPWSAPWYDNRIAESRRLRLPHKMLAPGQSYLICSVDDEPYNIWPLDPERHLGQRTGYYEMFEKADLQIHFEATEWGNFPAEYDSVSPYGWNLLDNWGGRSSFYIMHYFKETELERDSVIVDAFNAAYNAETSPYKSTGGSDAAGVTGATGNRILVRKATVTEGTGDALDSWTLIAGVDITDSEWLPLRFPQGGWNPLVKPYWTIGNHGDFTLSTQSIKGKTSATVVDIPNKKITVPWGVRNEFYFLDNFVESPGLAWYYTLSAAKEDSAYASARTNDTITFYAVGNTLQEIKFVINVLPSTDADNIVMPKIPMQYNSEQYNGTYVNMGAYCGITTGHEVDTIMAGNLLLGIGYNTRVDSLLKYLEKPTQATWEIQFVDGVQRADLKNGDKLKVTAKNGSVKEYFIKIDRYAPNKIARLSAITWPDVPESLKGFFGWKGDTIPGFSGTNYDYTISIPAETAGMPALVAKPEQLNTTVQVHRATNLAGSLADRTVTFNTTAEDGTTKLTYKVTMNKEKALEDVEPYFADPFISEFVYRDQWANSYMEVVNPGNQLLDMSNYMFAYAYVNSPAEAITMQTAADSWANRYLKYIPGYKWVDQATWETQPAMVVPDPAVDPIVYPGEVFVIGDRRGGGQVNATQHPWWGGYKTNVDFGTGYNPWGETIGACLTGWHATNYYLFRIDNDSIKLGLKAASDPNDFTLIDVFGSGDGTNSVVNGRNIDQIQSFTRKPHIYHGNTEFKGSFGTNDDDSEWFYADRPYWVSRGYGWPVDILMICSGLGSHFMNEPTAYKSTINSVAYKVSEGYGPDETLRGVKANTTVDDFLTRILKANPGQTLTLKNAAGNVLTGTQKLTNGDKLEVLSADSVNTSVYTLNVTEKGLSSNAILSSATYFISVDVTTGGIYLIPQGTKLTDAIANVVVPEGATLTVVDGNDAWVPFKKLNFDSTYVDVIVTDNIYFEVLAEDGLTMVRYQLVPDAEASDAFVTSDLYAVDQSKLLISFVPRGTEVSSFLRNVIPVRGATIKVVDKNGLQRTKGALYQDDMLVVTSKDGKVTKTYYLDMLRTEFLSTAYLAYVLSDTYKVDQIGKVITKPMAESAISDLMAKLTPAFGAQMAIFDKNGVAKPTTGKLMRGDVLKVTSADGKIVNTYALELDYTAASTIRSEISVYPNPTDGEVHIRGLQAGNRVRVINLTGALLFDRVAGNSLEMISLRNQPSGMYFITVSDAGNVIGQYKVIRK